MTANLEIELEDEESEDEHMATYEHSMIGNTLNRLLGNYVNDNKLGQVLDGSIEYRFLQTPPGKKRKPYRQPDISFVSQTKVPKRFRSYPDIAPDLAIEIESPTDYGYNIQAKVAEYQEAGVKLVWVIHPYARLIDVYRLNTGRVQQIYSANEVLSGEDVIPGFTLPVSAVFNYPEDPNPEPEG